MNKKHMALAALVALPLALTGCGGASTAAGGSPAPSAASTAAAAQPTVGKPFTADMGNGNVAKITIVSAKWAAKASTSQFAPAAKSGKFLILDVLWETEKGKTSSNPMYFNVKDDAGRKADMTIAVDQGLGSGDVVAGDKSRGNVAFDVAPGPVTVTITNPIMQTVATIKVAP